MHKVSLLWFQSPTKKLLQPGKQLEFGGADLKIFIIWDQVAVLNQLWALNDKGYDMVEMAASCLLYSEQVDVADQPYYCYLEGQKNHNSENTNATSKLKQLIS